MSSNKNGEEFRMVKTNSFRGFKTRYVGPSGNRSLEFYLEPGYSIITLPGSLLYMRGNVEKGTIKVDSSSFFRFFTGETFTLVSYKGMNVPTNKEESSTTSERIKGSEKGGHITLGLTFPGDIICIEVKKDSKIKFLKNSFLACTPNLDISGKFDYKQLIPVGTDFEPFLGHVSHKENSNESGYVWLSTYGVFEKIYLKKGDEIIVDNGMFLACNEDYSYKVSRLGRSMFGGIVSGEGWGVQFSCKNDEGMTIYCQTKSINDLILLLRVATGSHGGADKKKKRNKKKTSTKK